MGRHIRRMGRALHPLRRPRLPGARLGASQRVAFRPLDTGPVHRRCDGALRGGTGVIRRWYGAPWRTRVPAGSRRRRHRHAPDRAMEPADPLRQEVQEAARRLSLHAHPAQRDLYPRPADTVGRGRRPYRHRRAGRPIAPGAGGELRSRHRWSRERATAAFVGRRRAGGNRKSRRMPRSVLPDTPVRQSRQTGAELRLAQATCRLRPRRGRCLLSSTHLDLPGTTGQRAPSEHGVLPRTAPVPGNPVIAAPSSPGSIS